MVYLLFKLLFCDFFVDTITQFILKLLRCKRITELLVYLSFRNEIVQEMPFRYTYKFKRIDYMRDREEFKKLLVEEYRRSFLKASEMFEGKKMWFVTNQFVYKHVLLPLQEQEILRAVPVSTKNKKQIPEKLVFISPVYIYRHLFDSNFWRAIFKDEKVTCYVIEFPKRQER